MAQYRPPWCRKAVTDKHGYLLTVLYLHLRPLHTIPQLSRNLGVPNKVADVKKLRR